MNFSQDGDLQILFFLHVFSCYFVFLPMADSWLPPKSVSVEPVQKTKFFLEFILVN